MTKSDNRRNIVLKTKAASEPPSRKAMPAEQETPNPAPDKDYSDREQPLTEGEENDSAIDDE